MMATALIAELLYRDGCVVNCPSGTLADEYSVYREARLAMMTFIKTKELVQRILIFLFVNTQLGSSVLTEKLL
jgi:hypothetical protein